MKGQEEKELSYQIAAFLEFQYPKAVFRFDVAADLYLTQRQASIVKNKLKHKRGYHDLTILEPKGKYHGLLLELKKNKAEVFRQDGELKKKTNKKTGKCHNQEQKQHLDNMRKKGYFADYGFGFVDTVKKIKTYMDL